MKNKRKTSFWPVAFGLTGLCLLFPQLARLQQTSFTEVDLPPCAHPPLSKDPRMDSFLSHLVTAYRSQGEEAARALARQRGLDTGAPGIRLMVEAGTGLEPGQAALNKAFKARTAVSAMKADIEQWGGRVEAASRVWIQAVIPYTSLEHLLASPHLGYLRPPLRPYPHVTVSEGVSRVGADTWHELPAFHGPETVKVCILDVGFEDYKSLLGTELPSEERVTVRSFRADKDIEAGEVHGAACAEIVHDMAPDAHLYLVNFDSSVEQASAVNWLIGQDVDIISYSMGWFNAGAGDGTGPICDDVELAASHGIIWTGSAGNYALDHWEGVFSDTDSDDWHNFSPADELLEFEVPARDELGVFLNWDDWGTWNGWNYSGSNQDYDLYLYKWNGLLYELVASSTDPQTGRQWPIEELYYYSSPLTTQWAVAIRRANATRNVKLELFLSRNSSKACEYNVPEGSISVPADSASQVTAGATDWSDDSYHYYSSRGPTHDGRIKPDIASPSGVSTRSYGMRSFYGTSASAPHLAGAFALLLGKTPYSADDLHQMLIARALDLGPAGKDNQFGYGRLSLRR